MGDNNRDFDSEALPTSDMVLVDVETAGTVVV